MTPDQYLLTTIFLLLLNAFGAYYARHLRQEIDKHKTAMILLTDQMAQLTLLVTEKPYEQDARLNRLDKEINQHLQLRHPGDGSL